MFTFATLIFLAKKKTKLYKAKFKAKLKQILAKS